MQHIASWAPIGCGEACAHHACAEKAGLPPPAAASSTSSDWGAAGEQQPRRFPHPAEHANKRNVLVEEGKEGERCRRVPEQDQQDQQER
jgi:hypothetical protein